MFLLKYMALNITYLQMFFCKTLQICAKSTINKQIRLFADLFFLFYICNLKMHLLW